MKPPLGFTFSTDSAMLSALMDIIGPGLDLTPIPQPASAVAGDRSGNFLGGELMGPLLRHAEQGSDVHEAGNTCRS